VARKKRLFFPVPPSRFSRFVCCAGLELFTTAYRSVTTDWLFCSLRAEREEALLLFLLLWKRPLSFSLSLSLSLFFSSFGSLSPFSLLKHITMAEHGALGDGVAEQGPAGHHPEENEGGGVTDEGEKKRRKPHCKMQSRHKQVARLMEEHLAKLDQNAKEELEKLAGDSSFPSAFHNIDAWASNQSHCIDLIKALVMSSAKHEAELKLERQLRREQIATQNISLLKLEHDLKQGNGQLSDSPGC